jgi:sugar phosphate isomerase/epimerase
VQVQLGINNCFAVKRWPRPEEWAQIVVDELGLTLVQHSLDLSPGEDIGDEAQLIRRACDRNGLSIDSVFTGLCAYSTNLLLDPEPRGRERAERFWRRAIEFGGALGGRAVGGHVGSLSRRDADDPGRREILRAELSQRLRRLAGVARGHGVGTLLVENMACEREPCRMSDVAALLEPGDGDHAGVALCLDVGHQCAPGVSGADADPYAWLEAMGTQTAVVHLQQSDADGDHHWPFTREYNARGRIHGPKVLEALAASGVKSMTLMLEVIPPFEAEDGRVLAELGESVAYWKDVLHGHELA